MVAERPRVGLLFSYSDSWIGGTYYFLSLVKCLNLLDDRQKPHIVVFGDSFGSFKHMLDTGYPYLSFYSNQIKQTLVKRVINKVYRFFNGSNYFALAVDHDQLPVLFGYQGQAFRFECKRILWWVPDFQEKYYPDFIGAIETRKINQLHRQLAYSKSELVFSSQAALTDFCSFFPNHQAITHVVRFATSIPDIASISSAEILGKYSINRVYFMVPNQFWPHKNHMIVLKSLMQLKQQGIEKFVVFTGKEDYGKGSCVNELKKFVVDNSLQNNVRFLGFIDRQDQLVLMRESMAIIQPSLFEGWSTVVEDAKALGKFVFASDLMVHREQLNENCCFFNPGDHLELAERLQNAEVKTKSAIDYEKNRLAFASAFYNAIKKGDQSKADPH